MTAYRSVDDGEDTEVVYQQTKLSEWEFDVSHLGDALIKFFVFPRKLKKDHPEMYEQIAQQVMDSIPDDDEYPPPPPPPLTKQTRDEALSLTAWGFVVCVLSKYSCLSFVSLVGIGDLTVSRQWSWVARPTQLRLA